MKHLIIIIFCLAICSCQGKRNDTFSEKMQTDSILQVKGPKHLLMDDWDYPTAGLIRYHEFKGKPCLIQGNVNQKTIGVYDYMSGNKQMTVGTKHTNGEFFAYSSDTALVITNARGKSTVHMWIAGKNTSIDVAVSVRKGCVEQYPRCRHDSSVYLNGKWYFSCYRLGEYPAEMQSGKDRFPLLEVDMANKEYKFVGAYPEIYAHNNMGTLNYWVPTLCRGKNGGEVLVGFPASPEILRYSPDTGESLFVSVKSEYADTIPLPLTEKGRNYFNESDSYYYFAQYTHYGPISYDPWRDVYYRFVGIGLNDWSLDPSPLLQNQKSWSVMVFDSSFKKLGEQFMGKEYDINFHFVSPDGLFVLNKDDNEDVATYTLFEFIKKMDR